MSDGIDVMHRAVLSGLGAVVFDRDTCLSQALFEKLILAEHHVLITRGQNDRRTAEHLCRICEVEDKRRELLVRIEVDARELQSALPVITADRAGAFTCDIVIEIRDAALCSGILRIHQDRGQEAAHLFEKVNWTLAWKEI